MLPKIGIGTTGVSNLEVKTNITNHKRKWQDRRFFSFFLFSFLAQARSAVESEEVVNAGDERACGREDI